MGWDLGDGVKSSTPTCLLIATSAFTYVLVFWGAFLGIIILVGWLFPGIHVSSPFLGASLQPWKILSKGMVVVGPKGKLGGQSGAGPSPPNGIPCPRAVELTPRSSLSEPCNPPPLLQQRPPSLPSLLGGLPPAVPVSLFCGQRPSAPGLRRAGL